jgi:hypothetical protein
MAHLDRLVVPQADWVEEGVVEVVVAAKGVAKGAERVEKEVSAEWVAQEAQEEWVAQEMQAYAEAMMGESRKQMRFPPSSIKLNS